MQLTLPSPKIYIASQPIDFRRSIDGLCSEVIAEMKLDPADGIFVFYNTQKNKLKILTWHHNGFVMLYKRLERGRFTVVRAEDGQLQIDETQFSWLLAGLDWKMMSEFKELNYDTCF